MNASENVYLRTNYTINPNSKEEKKLIDQLPIMKSVRSIVVSIREEELCGTGNLNKCAKQKNRCPLASGDNEIRICAQVR